MGYEIDFLPVGEGEKSGDAIALRFGNLSGQPDEQMVIVIDGGFKESGEKLVEHIERCYGTGRVDIVVSTHPDSDHASGLEVVLDELEDGQLWMHQPWNHTDDITRMFRDGRVTDNSVREKLRKSLDAARTLERLAESKGIPIIEPFTGTHDSTESLFVLGPSASFYESLLPSFRGTPEPVERLRALAKAFAGAREFITKVAENWNIETLSDDGETSAENNSSVILMLSVENQRSLFTADAGIPALTQVADLLDANNFDYSTLGFIQVPHHGSKRNVGPTILNRLVGPRVAQEGKPMSAFVSASKEGEPKHPAKKVMNAFRRRGAPVHATQGVPRCHYFGVSPRSGWTTSTPLPFYAEVDE